MDGFTRYFLLFFYFQVAECLGKLCLLEPKDLLPHLKEFLKSPEPLTRTTAVTAVKFTISDQVSLLPYYLVYCQ